MNRMINTPIMTESEVELVNSLTTSILETSIPDALSNKESDSSYMSDISFSGDNSDDELMSKVRFITSSSPTLVKNIKKRKNSNHPKKQQRAPKNGWESAQK